MHLGEDSSSIKDFSFVFFFLLFLNEIADQIAVWLQRKKLPIKFRLTY